MEQSKTPGWHLEYVKEQPILLKTNFAQIFLEVRRKKSWFLRQIEDPIFVSCRKILKEKVWVWYFCLVLTKVIWFSSGRKNTVYVKKETEKLNLLWTINKNQVPRIIQKFWEYHFLVVIFNNKMERTICKLVVKSRFETLKKPARTIHC